MIIGAWGGLFTLMIIGWEVVEPQGFETVTLYIPLVLMIIFLPTSLFDQLYAKKPSPASKIMESPLQKVLGVEVVMVGVWGNSVTVIVKGSDVFLQPFLSVTMRV